MSDAQPDRAKPKPQSQPPQQQQQQHRGAVPDHLREQQRAQEQAVAKRYEAALKEAAKTGVPPDPSLKPYWIR